MQLWKVRAGRLTLPFGGATPPAVIPLLAGTEERRALLMYVTYADLIQMGIFICTLIGLCYTIFRDKRK